MKETAENAGAPALHTAIHSDTTPQAREIGISTNPIGIGNSVDPIGITPDSPSVPSGASFGLTLTLSTAPTSPSTVTAYIMPAGIAMNTAAQIVVTEDVHFSNPANNQEFHIQAVTQTAIAASPVSLPLIMAIFPGQQQQHLRLPAPIVTVPSQYVVKVVGHDNNNNPTNGVSTTITVHP